MHNFSLSYTRKVTFPVSSQLTTFILYEEESLRSGNDNIRPQFTNFVESRWTKYFSKFGSISATAFFKNNKNEIIDFTDWVYNEYFGREVTYTQPLSSGKTQQYGAELNVMYKIKPFMNLRFNAKGYQYHGIAENPENVQMEVADCFNYSFQLAYWAKLWKFLEINASGFYRSKSKTIFWEEPPVYALNCGVRANFWENKVSLFLNVQDIFNWNKRETSIYNPRFIYYNSETINSRYISAGITFQFGNFYYPALRAPLQ
jgi:outer membrane receptor protein involved in Fe transport